jgi:hypothetical protein
VLRLARSSVESSYPPDSTGASISFHTTTTARSIAPRVGYAFRLGDEIVFWPRAWVGVTSTTTDYHPAAGQVGTLGGVPGVDAQQTAGGSGFELGADASFLFAFGRHAAVGAGPALRYASADQDQPSSSSKSVDLAARASLRLVF